LENLQSVRRDEKQYESHTAGCEHQNRRALQACFSSLISFALLFIARSGLGTV
jgi:hypothetical protein